MSVDHNLFKSVSFIYEKLIFSKELKKNGKVLPPTNLFCRVKYSKQISPRFILISGEIQYKLYSNFTPCAG